MVMLTAHYVLEIFVIPFSVIEASFSRLPWCSTCLLAWWRQHKTLLQKVDSYFRPTFNNLTLWLPLFQTVVSFQEAIVLALTLSFTIVLIFYDFLWFKLLLHIKRLLYLHNTFTLTLYDFLCSKLLFHTNQGAIVLGAESIWSHSAASTPCAG